MRRNVKLGLSSLVNILPLAVSPIYLICFIFNFFFVSCKKSQQTLMTSVTSFNVIYWIYHGYKTRSVTRIMTSMASERQKNHYDVKISVRMNNCSRKSPRLAWWRISVKLGSICPEMFPGSSSKNFRASRRKTFPKKFNFCKFAGYKSIVLLFLQTCTRLRSLYNNDDLLLTIGLIKTDSKSLSFLGYN